jgi:LacI family transcriptional regulator
MAVNQKQIAERLGVSIAVVSRSLSGTAREIGISDETIQRVKETAVEMGYVPNAAARALKGKSSQTIGVVVYDFLDPYFGVMIEQLHRTAHEEGYSLVLVGFQGRDPAESDLAPLHKHTIDGLVVLGSADQSAWLNDFKHIPVVRVGHGDPTARHVCVSIDETAAAIQLLDHLEAVDCSGFAFVGSRLYAHELRAQAIEQTADVRGMRFEKIILSEDGFAAGLRAVESLRTAGGESQVLVCATDTIAMGALHALHAAGLRWRVTGFDDIPAAAQFVPSITTIRQPAEEIVRQAVAAIAGKQPAAEILLPGRLVVRESTASV